jgi:thiol-disulfide isomerase/thioredoxin
MITVSDKAKNLKVSEWVQGGPIEIEKEKGKVILVEVFQVNCPGCFLYGLPMAQALDKTYKEKGLLVIGLATAFEDFEVNNLENLKLVVKKGIAIGEPKRVLKKEGLLKKRDKLHFKIDFPVAMDRLRKIDKNYYLPETFEEYGLKGTPSSIVIDKQGIVRYISFGYDEKVEKVIKELLFLKAGK